MEPISSIYSIISSSPISHARNHENAFNQSGLKGTPNSPSQSSNATQAAEVRIGGEKSPDSDFKPYNQNGRFEDKKSEQKLTVTNSSSATEAQPAKQQEDPRIQQIISQLKSTEEKVKAHEAAHKSAGGAATGPISYTYTRGPDGKNYITGGEVPITISSGSTPQETISRMQQVIQAALAPADPSPQDRAVAAQASNIKMQAQQEKAQQDNPLINGQGQGEQTAVEGAATDGTGSDVTGAVGESTTDSTDKSRQLSSLSGRAYSDPAVQGQPSPSDSQGNQLGQNLLSRPADSGTTNRATPDISPYTRGFEKPVSFYA
jgi:hypothetical protein